MDQSRGVPDGTEQNDPPPPQSSSTTLDISSTAATSDNPNPIWKPNDQYLISLTSMGFNTLMAKKALYYTDNQSTEAAIDWIFSNGDSYSNDDNLPWEIQQQLTPQQSSSSSSSGLIHTRVADAGDDLYKMVFVVNSELTMGVGKIAAQVAHAALGLHRLLLQHQNKYGEPFLNWTEYGETKIVLRGENTNHLVELETKAIKLDLPCYMVHDAGKTQVKSGSTTVLGIFGSNNLVDQVTGQLKLY